MSQSVAQQIAVVPGRVMSASDSVVGQGSGVDNAVRALLVPHREATISSEVAARIGKIHVKDGDTFKEGDALVTFSCDVRDAKLRAAQAELKRYQTTYNANLRLRQEQAVSSLELAVSAARVDEARANVDLAKAELRKCRLVAPYDGRVVKVFMNEHETTGVGDPLIAILNDSRLEMLLHLPSQSLPSVHKGTKFRVHIDETGQTYDAKITRISPRIDASSRTLEVRAEIMGSHPNLLAGMSGNAILEQR